MENETGVESTSEETGTLRNAEGENFNSVQEQTSVSDSLSATSASVEGQNSTVIASSKGGDSKAGKDKDRDKSM